MAVNNTLLKKIIMECCRSLSYNDEERQFTFPLYPCIMSIWDKIKFDLTSNSSHFYLCDFNQLLTKLSDLNNQYTRIEVNNISDVYILPGEVLELTMVDIPIPFRLIKMKDGQYLNARTGKGYTFGKKFEFINNNHLVTSEGYILGIIKSIAFLSLSIEHIVLSKQFIGNYYRRAISDSIWPIFEKVVNNSTPRYDTDFTEYLVMSKNLGINSFSLLNILNAGTCLWR